LSARGGAAGPQDRQTLRIALAAAGALTAGVTFGWTLPFLAPVLAVNLLTALPRVPRPAQALGFVLLIVVTGGAVLAATSAFASQPTILAIVLGALLFVGFYLDISGAGGLVAMLLLIMTAVLPVLVALSPGLATGLLGVLVGAGITAVFFAWLVDTLLPGEMPSTGPGAPAARPAAGAAAHLAFMSTLIALPVEMKLVAAPEQVSIVTVMIVINVLRACMRGTGNIAALALIFGNLVGGLAAALVYQLIAMCSSIVILLLAALLVALWFGARITGGTAAAPAYIVGLVTFFVVLGLSLSPITGGAEEIFLQRLLDVVVAAAYAVGAAAVLMPFGRPPRGRGRARRWLGKALRRITGRPTGGIEPA